MLKIEKRFYFKSMNEDIEIIAKSEEIPQQKIKKLLGKGRVVLMGCEGTKRILIGDSMRTKVNVNLGTSSSILDEALEYEKASLAQTLGADTISDCSTRGDLDKIRQYLLKSTELPLTTIPIYQVSNDTSSFVEITKESILKTIEKHVNDGVSSVVIHAGFDLKSLNYLKNSGRIMGMVSKGGSMTAAVMLSQQKENPFWIYFDEILEILKDTGVVLNLGNAMRSGCIHDLQDVPQFEETIKNTKLADRANAKKIPVIIEGLGGHVNAYNLPKLVKKHKSITNCRPLFVAGPLPTEIGVGYDHISAAIGGAMAAGYGADYLCAITPAEHLALPNLDQLKEGIVSAKIAAHVGDSIKYGLNRFFDVDRELSRRRYERSWGDQLKYAIDPERAKKIHPPGQHDCSMCGKNCAIMVMKKYLFKK